MEIAVVAPDGIERLRGGQADDVVDLGTHAAQDVVRRHRHRHHQARRLLAPHGLERHPQRGAGGDAVVDHDHRRPPQRHRCAAVQVEDAAAVDLVQLLEHLGLEVVGVELDRRHHLVVEDDVRRRAVDHRGDGQLGLPRRADLAHQQQVEPGVQHARQLGADRHAPTRQREHHHGRRQAQCSDLVRQETGRLGTVGKRYLHVLHPLDR